MEQLLEACDDCQGTGYLPPPAPPPQGSFGPRVVMMYQETCSKCNGRGKLLTEAGKAIKAVLDHVQQNGR